MAVPFLPGADALEPDDGTPDVPAELAALADIGCPADTAEAVAMFVASDEFDGRWRIDNADRAEWAMARLAEARANLGALAHQRANYVARVNDWHTQAAASVELDVAFFAGHLILWAQEIRSQSGGKVKTARVPSGEVRTTKAGPLRATIDDADAVLAWALEARDTGRNTVRSRLLLDVMAATLAAETVVVADEDGAPVVVDRVTGERVPGAVAAQTPERAKVVTYEADEVPW